MRIAAKLKQNAKQIDKVSIKGGIGMGMGMGMEMQRAKSTDKKSS